MAEEVHCIVVDMLDHYIVHSGDLHMLLAVHIQNHTTVELGLALAVLSQPFQTRQLEARLFLEYRAETL